MKKIFKRIALFSVLGVSVQLAQAQVKIGDNPTAINKASILELESGSKGLLFPRVSLTNTTTWGLAAGSTPDAGMVVYNTKTVTAGFTGSTAYPTTQPDGTGLYYWDGNGWVAVRGNTGNFILNGTGAPAASTGNDGDYYIDPTTNKIYGPKAGGAWPAGISLIGATGAAGANGKSAFEVWQSLPGNSSKTLTDYFTSITGPAGLNGADGKSLLSGSGAPSGGTGKDGDFFIDPTTNTIYGPKTGGVWPPGVSIVGATGPAGANGKSAFEIWQSLPGNSSKTITEYFNSITGPAGADGKTILNGTGAPAGTTGKDGDFYIDPTSNTIYGPKAGGVWPAGVSIVGAAGANGKSAFEVWQALPGNSSKTITDYLASITGPAGATGADGKSAFEVWQALPGNAGKTITDYLAAITGPTGATGATGADGKSAFEVWQALPGNAGKTITDYLAAITGATGAAGADGKTILNGTGAPSGATGKDGDFYIDPTTNTIYGPKAGGMWPAGVSIVGATGATGATGADGKSAFEVWQALPGNAGKTITDYLAAITGPTGATGATGADGKSAFEVWQALPGNAGKTITDYLAAITGATGAAGADGKTILNGTGAPSGATGKDGDFYIDPTTNTIYGPKAGGMWPAGVSIVGATGATGATGADGKSAFEVWQALPGNAGKTITDYLAAITGPTGATGATGADGKSAFEVWQALPGNAGKTITDYLAAITGATGAAGADGKTILNGAGAPSGATGKDGDFYIDPTTNTIYGPKAGGVWPAGVSIKGADGQGGVTQAGTDIAISGTGTVIDPYIVSNKITADNGLTKTAIGVVQLGGALTNVTKITTDATNTLAIDGLQTGAATNNLVVVDANGVLKTITPATLSAASNWLLSGNAGTNPTTNFIGTTDAQPLALRTNNAERMRILSNGKVGIGTTVPAARLDVQTVAGENDVAHFITGGVTTSNMGEVWIGNDSGAWASLASGNSIFQIKNVSTSGVSLHADLANNRIGIGNTAPSNSLHVTATADPLRLEGLQTGLATNDFIVADANGVLKKVSASALTADLRVVGMDNHITQDAGIGSNGSSVGTGPNNIAIGKNALSSNTTGHDNLAVGLDALLSNTGGYYNTALGAGTLNRSVTGISNVAVGAFGLGNLVSGSSNTAIGVSSLQTLGTGIGNVAIGDYAAGDLKNGNRNTALGYNTRLADDNGSYQLNIMNSIFGVGMNGSLIAPAGMVGINQKAPTNTLHVTATADPLRLEGLQTGLATNDFIVADANGVLKKVSASALTADVRVVGTNNHISQDAGVGSNGTSAGTGANNIGIGINNFSSITIGSENIAIGGEVMSKNTVGSLNTAIGPFALHENTTGSENVAIGGALTNNTTGYGNVAIGQAGQGIVTGNYNIVLGYGALQGGSGNGNRNIVVGAYAGNNLTTGGNNLILGDNANVPSATANHQMSIMNAIFGSGLNGTVTSPKGSIGINQPSPTNTLHVTATADPLRLEGLQAGLATNDFIVADANGVLKKVSASALTADVRVVGTDNHISQDAGVGSNGSSVGTGANNVAIGKNTLSSNTTGSDNLALGQGALKNNTVGSGNAALGQFTLSNVSDGTLNVGFGNAALYSLLSGVSNTAVGSGTLENLQYGSGNTTLGVLAGGDLVNGGFNTSLGFNTQLPDPNGSYQLNIMNSIFGVGMNGNVTNPAGMVGINQTAPTNTLHVTATADPLRLEGLQAGLATDAIVVADANGVLKTVSNTTFAISTKTANYTALGTDETILVDASSGNVTITLPTTVVTGKKYYIKKIDTTSNDVIVDGAGATIDGSPSITGSLAYQGWVLQYNGTAWFIISRN
ncbi:beta strand repeat-containing protein [Nubsella zeaxanthinifaciens]|uniref:beta strand repeat-containing protein n=1 Tax=Nubsella zeaxanthinifaciens TaxID=392412 RepID=UPI003D02345E